MGEERDIIADTFVYELPAVFTGPCVELVFQTDGIEVFAVFLTNMEQKILGSAGQQKFGQFFSGSDGNL